MADCILNKNQKAACLTKMAEDSKKVKLKNVLCGDNHAWPKPSREVEDKILSKLSEILKSLPNIFKPVKTATREQQEKKRKVRAQLDLGTNCVLRSLEKDRLGCVLVSGKTTPASAVQPLISTARERGCPLICLDSLAITLAKVTKSKCLPVCIGFKKLMANAHSDFAEVMSLVRENTRTQKAAHLNAKNRGNICIAKAKLSLPESLRPISLDAGTDEAVREGLKTIFSKASFQEAKKKMWTPRDKKRKKDKNKKKLKQHFAKWFHSHFECGKRTVMEFVGRGKMSMVFVVPALVPVLMAESTTMSLLCVARDQDCPVLCLSNLDTVACVNTEKSLAVLGIKKESSLPAKTPSAFSSVIEKCHNFMRHAPMPAQDMDCEVGDDPVAMRGQSGDVGDENEEEEQDYSFLYVMKKDSSDLHEKAVKLKEERAEASKQLTFSSDFISLSGGLDKNSPAEWNANATTLGKRKIERPLFTARSKPKKMLLDTELASQEEKGKAVAQANLSGDLSGFISLSTAPSQQCEGVQAMSTDTMHSEPHQAVATGNLFAISRAGDKTQIDAATTPNQDTDKHAPQNILGGKTLDSSHLNAESEHILNVFSATERQSSKNESKIRHGQEGFVSLGYTEANIHTMVSSSDRKKTKKGKKK